MSLIMKTLPNLKRILTLTLVFSTFIVTAQEPELEEYMQDLEELLGKVEANGRTYQQKIKSSELGKVTITVNEIDSRGGESETVYALALADINPRAARSFPKGDIVLVELFAKGNEKLFKKTWDGGQKIAYVPDFILYASDRDNGGDLKQAFQESVAFAVEVDQKAFSLDTYEDHLNWLREHIASVTLADGKIDQSLKPKSDQGDAVIYDLAKDGRTSTAVFNLSQLNPNSIEYHVSGDETFIEVFTKGGTKAIKYSENGSLKDYRDILTIYADTPDKLKKIRTVLKRTIPLATQKFDDAQPDFGSGSEIVEELNRDIQEVSTVDGRIKQQIMVDGDIVTMTAEEITDKRQLKNEYEFSLTDINALSIKNESTSSGIRLVLPIKNDQPFIKHIENDRPQNYRDYVRLYFDSREEALRGEKALKKLIRDAQSKMDAEENSGRMTIPKAWDNLKSAVIAVEIDGQSFEQDIEVLDNETSAMRFTKVVTDRKNSREFVYEFGAKEINPFSASVQVSRSRVWVELITRNKKKAIKLELDGNLENYQYVVDIEASSIANAKEILKNIKKLSELYDARIGQ